jgi:hypothetical protein
MYNIDRSSSGHTRKLKIKTLADYHNKNPTKNDYGGEKPSSPLTQLLRTVGQNELCMNNECCKPVCDISDASSTIYTIANLNQLEADLLEITGQTIVIPSPPSGYPSDRYITLFQFPEVCNATSYTAKFYNPYPISIPIVQNFIGVYNTPGSSYLRSGFIVVYTLLGLDIVYPISTFITASN